MLASFILKIFRKERKIEMKKITVKKFIDGYNNCSNTALKDRYIKEKLVITPYVPVLRKDALADIIARRTVFEYENYVAEDGTEKNRSTGNVKVNTFIGYMLFVRTVIAEYTNLEIDKEHFDQDYDALKISGLLNRLMGGENSLIPCEEIAELNTIVDMKKNDLLTTESSIDVFVRRQIDRFKTLAKATLTPLANIVKEKLDGLSEEDLGKIVEFAKKGDFKEV